MVQLFNFFSAIKFWLLSFILFPLFTGALIKTDESSFSFYLTNYSIYSPQSIVTLNLASGLYGKHVYNFQLIRITDPLKFFSSENAGFNYVDILPVDSVKKYIEPVYKWSAVVVTPNSNKIGNVDVGRIDEPGYYILQASKDDQVAYCPIIISNYFLIYKLSGNQLIAFAANSKTGSFVEKTNYILSIGNKKIEKTADENGLASFNISSLNQKDNFTLSAKVGNEIVFAAGNLNHITSDKNDRCYIYTNKPEYKPGEKVFYKVFLHRNTNVISENSSNQSLDVIITSPQNEIIYTKEIKTNKYGSAADSLILPADIKEGNYKIIIKNYSIYSGNFKVEEYKLPAFSSSIITEKTKYSRGETITGKINAEYSYGIPVSKGEVLVNIYKQYFWRPWWYWSDFNWFYNNFNDDDYFGYKIKNLVSQQTGNLDKKGNFDFEYKIDEDINTDYQYIIEAEISDSLNRKISPVKIVNVSRGNFTLSTTPYKYFADGGKPIPLKINASDFSNNPVETKFTVNIIYPDNKSVRSAIPTEDVLRGKTGNDGECNVMFIPKYSARGYFTYTVTAYDLQDNRITTQGNFYIGDLDNYKTAKTDNLQIVNDKESYLKGDSLRVFIFLPVKNTEVLVSFESDTLIKYEKYSVKGNSLEIKEKLTDKFCPLFNISVMFTNENKIYSTSKKIGVLDKTKFLNISMLSNKMEFKPGDKGNIKIKVTDSRGKPVPNTELTFSLKEDSLIAQNKDKDERIEKYFYTPEYSEIYTGTSRNINSFHGRSRPAVYLDNHLFNDIPLIKNNNNNINISGKIFGEKTKKGLANENIIFCGRENIFKAETDSVGNYWLNELPKADYMVFAKQKIGGYTAVENLIISENGNYDIKIKDNSFFENEIKIIKKTPKKINPESNEIKLNSRQLKGSVNSGCWNPSIITDTDGTAEINFTLPNQIAKWRANVKAINLNSEVGEKSILLSTQKKLWLRMNTPQFFKVNDKAFISTILYNYLPEQKSALISFEAEGLEVIDSKINSRGIKNFNKNGQKYNIEINSNSEVQIDWIVHVNKIAGTAKIKASALTNDDTDAVEYYIPILPNDAEKN